MGCKATKTGVLMKWLVCASIYMYVLLFVVLNSNKLYLLAFFFFIFKLFYGLYFICKCTHITATIFFSSGATLSCCVMVCKNTGTCTVFNAKSSLMRVCMYMCVFKFFFEINEPTEDKVHVGPTQDREENLFK